MVNQTPENDPSRWNPTWGNQPFPAPNPIEYPNQQYPGQENFQQPQTGYPENQFYTNMPYPEVSPTQPTGLNFFPTTWADPSYPNPEFNQPSAQQPQWNPDSNNTMSDPYNPALYPAPAQNQAYSGPEYGYSAPSQPNMAPSAYPTTPLGEWNYPQTQGVKQKKSSSRLLAFFSLLGACLTLIDILAMPWFSGPVPTSYGDYYWKCIRLIAPGENNLIARSASDNFIPWIFFGIALVIAIISLLGAIKARAQFWASITALLSLINTSLAMVGLWDPEAVLSNFNYRSGQFTSDLGEYGPFIGSAISLICSIIGIIIGKARTRK